MNAPTDLPRTAALFRSNRNQAVRIPKDMEFAEGLDRVVIRRMGKSLVLTPKDSLWEDFLSRRPADDDFTVPDDPTPTDEIAPL